MYCYTWVVSQPNSTQRHRLCCSFFLLLKTCRCIWRFRRSGSLLMEENHWLPVRINGAFPNQPPKASFSNMYILEVGKFDINVVSEGFSATKMLRGILLVFCGYCCNIFYVFYFCSLLRSFFRNSRSRNWRVSKMTVSSFKHWDEAKLSNSHFRNDITALSCIFCKFYHTIYELLFHTSADRILKSSACQRLV